MDSSQQVMQAKCCMVISCVAVTSCMSDFCTMAHYITKLKILYSFHKMTFTIHSLTEYSCAYTKLVFLQLRILFLYRISGIFRMFDFFSQNLAIFGLSSIHHYFPFAEKPLEDGYGVLLNLTAYF